MTTAVVPVVLGHTYPRIATPPLVTGSVGPCGCGCALTPETSYGFDVVDFARDVLEFPLDPWQRYLAIHAGELQPDGLPRFKQVLVLVARQNGKTKLLMVMTLYWMYIDRVPMVLGTSSNLGTARETWTAAIDMAEELPVLAHDISKTEGIRKTNGQEELKLSWGGRYKIAASNRKGGRGFTVDRLVMDEFREHDNWDAYNAAEPATSAVRDSQIFMISNAGSDRSAPLNEMREQAVKGVDKRLGIFEWSSEDGMAADDPEALAMANPNLGHRIDLDGLIGQARRAVEAGGEQLTGFLTERHCRHVPLLNPAIDLNAWAECKAESSLDALRDRVALCVDVSLDELHATLYAAAVDGEQVRVSAVTAWEGQRAVAQMMSELPGIVARVKPRVIGWYPTGPAASAAAELDARRDWPPPGVKLLPIAAHLTAVCMGFAEQVRSHAIVHEGDPLLDAHLSAAEKIYQGDGWRFTRKGAGQVDAAYACAGAVHLARTLPQPIAPRVTVLQG